MVSQMHGVKTRGKNTQADRLQEAEVRGDSFTRGAAPIGRLREICFRGLDREAEREANCKSE